MSSIGGGSWPRVPRNRLVKDLLRRGEQPARLGIRLGRDHVARRPSRRACRAAPRAGTARDRPAGPASALRARSGTRKRRAAPASPRAARRTGSTRGSRAARCVPVPGTAWTRWSGCSGPSSACSSSTSCGKVSARVGIAAQRPQGAAGPCRAPGRGRDRCGPDRGTSSVPNCSAIDQRRVVRQHDPARADADRLGAARDMADHDRGRRARDPDHVVVLRQPVAPVAPAFRVLREIEPVAQGVAWGRAARHGGEIKNREGGHEST